MSRPAFHSKLLDIFPEARRAVRAEPLRPVPAETEMEGELLTARLRVRFFDTGEETTVDAGLSAVEEDYLRILWSIQQRPALNPHCLGVEIEGRRRTVYVLAIEDPAAQAAVAAWAHRWQTAPWYAHNAETGERCPHRHRGRRAASTCASKLSRKTGVSWTPRPWDEKPAETPAPTPAPARRRGASRPAPPSLELASPAGAVLVVDLEASGRPERDKNGHLGQIVEVGAAVAVDGTVRHELSFLVRPPGSYSEVRAHLTSREAYYPMKAHGIPWRTILSEGIPEADAAARFHAWAARLLERYPNLQITAHGQSFDLAFLERAPWSLSTALPGLRRAECMLRRSKRLLPGQRRHRLSVMAEWAAGRGVDGARARGTLHRAGEDARISAWVWLALDDLEHHEPTGRAA